MISKRKEVCLSDKGVTAKKFKKASSQQYNDRCLQFDITWTEDTLALQLCLVVKSSLFYQCTKQK